MNIAEKICHDFDRLAEVRDAMSDLLAAPKGVVPESAAKFFDGNSGLFMTSKLADHLKDASFP